MKKTLNLVNHLIDEALSEQQWNKNSTTPRDYSKEYNAPGSKEQDERNKRKRDKRKHDKECGECPEGEELHHIDGIDGEDLKCEPISQNRGRKEKSRLKKGKIVIRIKKKSEELNEGMGEWWSAIQADIASVFKGDKPVYTVDLLLSKIRQTDKVKNLKGKELVIFLQGLQKVQPKQKTHPGGAVQLGPEFEKNIKLGHQGRVLNNIINYAKNNPTMTLKDLIEMGNIKHARTPQSKEIATSFTNLANMLGAVGQLYAKYQEMDPTMAEGKNKKNDHS